MEVCAGRGPAALTELVLPGCANDELRLFAPGGEVRVPSLEVPDLTG